MKLELSLVVAAMTAAELQSLLFVVVVDVDCCRIFSLLPLCILSK